MGRCSARSGWRAGGVPREEGVDATAEDRGSPNNKDGNMTSMFSIAIK